MQKSTVQKLKAKLFQPHNIRDAEFSLALNGDVKTARKALKRSDSDYARRTYVRAVFSAVEGYITLIKGRTLLPHAPGKDTLTTADFAVFHRRLVDRRDVLQRNEEHVQRRLGVDVREAETQLITVHHLGRNLAVDDFAKETIGHGARV